MVVERHGVDVAVDSGGERRRQGSAVARRAGLRGKLNMHIMGITRGKRLKGRTLNLSLFVFYLSY